MKRYIETTGAGSVGNLDFFKRRPECYGVGVGASGMATTYLLLYPLSPWLVRWLAGRSSPIN